MAYMSQIDEPLSQAVVLAKIYTISLETNNFPLAAKPEAIQPATMNRYTRSWTWFFILVKDFLLASTTNFQKILTTRAN